MSVQSMQETETQGLADGAPTEDQNEFSFDKPDEFVRAPNTEDKHNFLMNIFFCFFWQFVCRRSPITDKDIYECGKRDRISAKKAIMEKHWNTQANLYLKEQAKLLRPPAETDNSQTQEGTQQVQQPDVRVKPPSIGRLLLGPVAGPRVALGLLFKALLFVFTILQPAMMKLMLLTVDKRNSDPSILFPFAPAIILILCPFLTGFCQSFAVRHFFHYMGSARATLIAQVYEKTMKLNINSQSNIDTGKMLSLVSSDAIIVGDYLFMPFNSSLIPFQIIVPFVLVVLDFGVTALISIAVLAIFLPLSTLCVGRAAKALKQSMACGDKRNKITNEILQGIRIVKFSGLENVFMDKIGLARRAQEKQTFWYMFWLNTVTPGSDKCLISCQIKLSNSISRQPGKVKTSGFQQCGRFEAPNSFWKLQAFSMTFTFGNSVKNHSFEEIFATFSFCIKHSPT
ncbi:Multidrug resistance-associated protein [Blattamonas nauphoetae]|uniref:Multidrug resistance-associated protein n=1 Tax=Blattamonas nauphoetae TaxID=2049346 RepID=A0ABQ9XHS8_9EUKA|nr:Multidrug resistance-associated protein [Blattamonas nauphoetae]